MVLACFCLMLLRASQPKSQCCSSSTTPLLQRVQMRVLYRLSCLECSRVALTGAWLSRNLDMSRARFLILGAGAVRYAGFSSSKCSACTPPNLIHCAYLQRCLLLLVSDCVNKCCVALQVIAEGMACKLCNQLVIDRFQQLTTCVLSSQCLAAPVQAHCSIAHTTL
jgi:hypothetical protein